MSTQHTPGPWHAKAVATFDEPGYVVLWEDRNKPGVHARRLDYKGCFAEHDAHLIAACPDMYEALKVVTGILNEIREGGEYSGSTSIEDWPELQAAYAALAKAEGKS